ncbi:MAG: thiocillin family RiPP, partial [bacterium]
MTTESTGFENLELSFNQFRSDQDMLMQPEFRRELRANPNDVAKALLEKAGLDWFEWQGTTVNVVTASKDKIYIPITPPADSKDLSPEQLAMVNAAGSASTVGTAGSASTFSTTSSVTTT